MARAQFGLTDGEASLLRRMTPPWRIQERLDAMDYDSDGAGCRSPRRVLRERRVQCMDGALFAAAALRVQGHPSADPRPGGGAGRRPRAGRLPRPRPLGADRRAPTTRACATASRCTAACATWPLSYFESYFNLRREKTLRRYSRPVDLARFDGAGLDDRGGRPLGHPRVPGERPPLPADHGRAGPRAGHRGPADVRGRAGRRSGRGGGVTIRPGADSAPRLVRVAPRTDGRGATARGRCGAAALRAIRSFSARRRTRLRLVVVERLHVALQARGRAASAEGHDPIDRARPVEVLERAAPGHGEHAIDEARGACLHDDLDADARPLVAEAEGHDTGQRVALDGQGGDRLRSISATRRATNPRSGTRAENSVPFLIIRPSGGPSSRRRTCGRCGGTRRAGRAPSASSPRCRPEPAPADRVRRRAERCSGTSATSLRRPSSIRVGVTPKEAVSAFSMESGSRDRRPAPRARPRARESHAEHRPPPPSPARRGGPARARGQAGGRRGGQAIDDVGEGHRSGPATCRTRAGRRGRLRRLAPARARGPRARAAAASPRPPSTSGDRGEGAGHQCERGQRALRPARRPAPRARWTRRRGNRAPGPPLRESRGRPRRCAPLGAKEESSTKRSAPARFGLRHQPRVPRTSTRGRRPGCARPSRRSSPGLADGGELEHACSPRPCPRAAGTTRGRRPGLDTVRPSATIVSAPARATGPRGPPRRVRVTVASATAPSPATRTFICSSGAQPPSSRSVQRACRRPPRPRAPVR